MLNSDACFTHSWYALRFRADFFVKISKFASFWFWGPAGPIRNWSEGSGWGKGHVLLPVCCVVYADGRIWSHVTCIFSAKIVWFFKDLIISSYVMTNKLNFKTGQSAYSTRLYLKIFRYNQNHMNIVTNTATLRCGVNWRLNSTRVCWCDNEFVLDYVASIYMLRGSGLCDESWDSSCDLVLIGWGRAVSSILKFEVRYPWCRFAQDSRKLLTTWRTLGLRQNHPSVKEQTFIRLTHFNLQQFQTNSFHFRFTFCAVGWSLVLLRLRH